MWPHRTKKTTYAAIYRSNGLSQESDLTTEKVSNEHLTTDYIVQSQFILALIMYLNLKVYKFPISDSLVSSSYYLQGTTPTDIWVH